MTIENIDGATKSKLVRSLNRNSSENNAVTQSMPGPATKKQMSDAVNQSTQLVL
jgi:hypothetical protein